MGHAAADGAGERKATIEVDAAQLLRSLRLGLLDHSFYLPCCRHGVRLIFSSRKG